MWVNFVVFFWGGGDLRTTHRKYNRRLNVRFCRKLQRVKFNDTTEKFKFFVFCNFVYFFFVFVYMLSHFPDNFCWRMLIVRIDYYTIYRTVVRMRMCIELLPIYRLCSDVELQCMRDNLFSIIVMPMSHLVDHRRLPFGARCW